MRLLISTWGRTTLTAAGILLGLALAAPSHAGTIFTLTSAVTITGANDGGTGVRGSLNPVDFTGSVLLNPPTDGDVSLASQDIFVVELELFGNSADVDALGFTVAVPLGPLPNFLLHLNANPKGAGALNDIAAGDVAPVTITADNVVAKQALFTFAGNTLEAGDTTVRLFATYSPAGTNVATNFLQINSVVSFMISSGTDFTVQGTIVPEPSTALLAGSGLLGLLAFARRARRR